MDITVSERYSAIWRAFAIRFFETFRCFERAQARTLPTKPTLSGLRHLLHLRTRQVEALIASAYLAGTNTRRVKRALAPLFKGAVGKDVVSRAWRKVSTDWTAWLRRDLAGEDVVRLIWMGPSCG